MILIKLNAFKIFFVGLALLCLMADETKAGKITKSKTTPVASAENTTISKSETETETEDTAGAAVTAQPIKEKQTTTATASDDAIPDSDSLSIWGIVSSIWNWIRNDFSESLLAADDDDDDAFITTAVNTSSAAAAASSSSAPIAAVEGRTFGKIRRLQMALIPIIFKFGVLTAMVAFLVMLGIKTLFLLKLLIFMNAAAILGKFLTLKTNFGHYEHAPVPVPAAVSWGYSNWNPHTPPHYGWSSAAAPAALAAPVESVAQHTAPNKEIHLHIHGAQTQPQVLAYSAQQSHSGGWESRSDPYSAYNPATINEADIVNELNNQGPISVLPTKYPANHRY